MEKTLNHSELSHLYNLLKQEMTRTEERDRKYYVENYKRYATMEDKLLYMMRKEKEKNPISSIYKKH